VNIGRYIKDLLQEHDTVIVPGLGAFISVYKPAYSDDKEGIILPPSRKVSFNPDIKNNGGVLASRIAYDEHISHRKAVGKVEKICDEILYKLDKGERVTLEDTGTLYYDQNGILNFEPAPSLNFLADAFGLEPVSIKDEKEDPEAGNTASLSGAGTDIQPKEPAGTSDKPDHLQDIGSQQDENFEFSDTDDDSLRGSGLHRSIFWSLVFIIPLILIVLGIHLFRKKRLNFSYPVEIVVESDEPSTELRDEQAAVIPIDSVMTDTVISQSDTVATAQVSDTAQHDSHIVPDKSKYYLIGGSFKEENNAIKYFQQMKEKGYEPFHLEEKGSFFIVGIGIFDTEGEAFIAQTRFLDKYPDSGAWVLIPE
jgi:nucleoid DNA-binding protein